MSGFDPVSAVIALLAAPVFIYVIKRFRVFITQQLGQFLDAIFWFLTRFFRRSLASRVSLRQYCRIQLGRKAAQFLSVPGANQTALPIDDVFVPLRLEIRAVGPAHVSTRTSSSSVLECESLVIPALASHRW